MSTDYVTLPSYWASALVNGDFSGFSLLDPEDEARETAAVIATMEELRDQGLEVIGIREMLEAPDEFSDPEYAEPHFTRNYHLYHPDPGPGITGGDVLDYAVINL